MMRFVLSICALVVVAWPVGALAQQPADFSGSWNLSSYRGNVTPNSGGAASAGGSRGTFAVGERPAATTSGGGNSVIAAAGRRTPAPQTATLRQTAGTLTIEEPLGDATRTLVYKLDGSESVNTFEAATLRTKSRWENGRLFTEGTQTVTTPQGDVSGTFREVRWLDGDGRMIIETTRGRDGREPTTSRAEYEK